MGFSVLCCSAPIEFYKSILQNTASHKISKLRKLLILLDFLIFGFSKASFTPTGGIFEKKLTYFFADFCLA